MVSGAGVTVLVPATEAGGSPPSAEALQEGDTPMPETQDGARAPDSAGTTATASPPTTPPAQVPVATTQAGAQLLETQYRTASTVGEASQAQVAVIAQERDSYRARCTSLAEALTEANNAKLRAEAERDRALAESRGLRANEAGRLTVDKMLTSDSGVPERLLGHISPRVHAAVHGNVPLTEHGDVDQSALEALVTSAIRQERVHAASLLEAQGVGRVEGLGQPGDPTMQMSTEQFEQRMTAAFQDIGLDDTTARLAVKGR
jgi:hypothetical protein